MMPLGPQTLGCLCRDRDILSHNTGRLWKSGQLREAMLFSHPPPLFRCLRSPLLCSLWPLFHLCSILARTQVHSGSLVSLGLDQSSLGQPRRVRATPGHPIAPNLLLTIPSHSRCPPAGPGCEGGAAYPPSPLGAVMTPLRLVGANVDRAHRYRTPADGSNFPQI